MKYVAVGAYCIRPELRRYCNNCDGGCNAVHAVACRAYAIRPYDYRNTKINGLWKIRRLRLKQNKARLLCWAIFGKQHNLPLFSYTLLA